MTTSPPDYEEADPGLARVRTSLAWTRTALSFAAVGAVALRKDVIAGLLILATAPVAWPTISPAGSGSSPRRSWSSPWSPWPSP
jgi:hypothetical protein